MRNLTCGTLLLIAVALGAVARADDGVPDQFDKVRERGSLEVAIYTDFPPFSYEKDGKIVGLDVDIAAAMAKALGLPLRVRSVIAGEDTDDDLRNFLWKGSVLGGGTADLMMHIGADPEYIKRQDHVSIFGIYLHESVALGLRPNRFKNFASLDQLKGKKTAVELGSISDLYLSGAFGGVLRESLLRLPSASAAVEAFIKDEADAVIAPRSEMQGLFKLLGAQAIEPKQVEFAGLFRSHWDVGMAIKSDSPKLKAALDAAFAKLENSGELAAIYARYGLDYATTKTAAAP